MRPSRLLSVLALLFASSLVPAFAASVTLTATPTTGLSPLSVTLNWTATGFASGATCAGAGATAWNGTKALSGTQTVSLLFGQYSLAISCSDSVGTADVTWTLPTQNEDGTTIPATGFGSLNGSEVFVGAATTPAVTTAKGVTVASLTGLPVGVNTFAVKVFNLEGIRSRLSSSASKTIVAEVATANAAVTVNAQPKPPAVTQVATIWETNGGMNKLVRVVGTIPIGTECYQQKFGSYWTIPRGQVTFTIPTTKPVVGRCA